MITTSAQPYRPTLSVQTNSGNSDLIRVTIREKGAEHSLTMHRGCWLELLDLLAQEIMDQAEGVRELDPHDEDGNRVTPDYEVV